MNKKIISSIIFLFLLTLFLFVVHIAISNMLPEPWNRLNVIFISAMCVLLFQKKDSFIWYIFILSLVAELFYSSPFGLNTATLFFAIIVMDWLLLNLLTNRFILTIFVAGLLGMLIYRTAYLLLFSALSKIVNLSFSINMPVIYDFLLEAIINALVLTIIFYISSLLLKKSNPKYLINK